MTSPVQIRYFVFVAMLVASCNATPLPMPPFESMEAPLVSFSAQPNGVGVSGAATAYRRGDNLALDGVIRITTVPFPPVETVLRADGSFGTVVPGPSLGDRFYFEISDSLSDRYLVTLIASAPARIAVEIPDRDADGSPDALDCAADDGSLVARQCMCVPEICDGQDNDCDGVVDNVFGCQASCSSDEDCGTEDVCCSGLCVDPSAASSCGGCEGLRCEGGLVCSDALMCVASCTDMSIPEACNVWDDDCDGSVDEDFDLQTDLNNCGACQTGCAVGESCMAGVCASECMGDDDCVGLQVCETGVCTDVECLQDSDCPTSRSCVGSVCALGPTCAADADCDAERGCEMGVCKLRCSPTMPCTVPPLTCSATDFCE